MVVVLLILTLLNVIAPDMNINRNTLLASVHHNVKMRDALGVNMNTSYTLYNTLLKYIDYCNSKSEVKYNSYATILREKLSILQNRCTAIKPRRINNIYDITLYDTNVLNKPFGDLTLAFNELVVSASPSITEVKLSSTDYLINGKEEVTIPVFNSIFLKSKYCYYSIDNNTVAEVRKLVDDNLLALGYYVEYIEDNKLYYFNGKHRVSTDCSILEKENLYSIIKVQAFYYDKETRHVSNECSIKIKLMVEDKESSTSTSASLGIEHLEYNITPTPERRVEYLPYSGKELDIPNFYSIESKSDFLTIRKGRVKLSEGYEYYSHNDSIIAVPKEITTFLNSGYEILEYLEGNMLQLSKLREDGNKEVISLITYDIGNSLYINYRVKEYSKEPSAVSSIQYKIDIDTVPTNNITNTIFVGYD